jgi:hypothetical protein
MARSARQQLDERWIALPGLFTDHELQGVTGLEIYAFPLVILGDEVLYGVYVKDEPYAQLLRELGERHSTEPPARS